LDLCPICNSSKTVKVYEDELGDDVADVTYNFSPHTRRTYRIVECGECTHQFVAPLPQLESLYKVTEDTVYASSLAQRRKSAECWMTIVRETSPNAKSLLDVGCNIGLFLDEAAKTLHAEGVELSEWASNQAARRHVVHQRKVSELQLHNKFDVATLWGVIEHLEDPAHEIAAVTDMLTKHGTLLIYTGDRSALLPRFLRKKWWWYQGMHIQYFTRASLVHLLTKLNFTIVEIRWLPIYFSLASLGQSINRYRIAKPLVWLLKLFKTESLLIRITLSGEMLVVARKN